MNRFLKGSVWILSCQNKSLRERNLRSSFKTILNQVMVGMMGVLLARKMYFNQV